MPVIPRAISPFALARPSRSHIFYLFERGLPAIDLLGGCAGALLLSTYLIPVFGFWKTAWLCAAINLAQALLAARVSLEEKRKER